MSPPTDGHRGAGAGPVAGPGEPEPATGEDPLAALLRPHLERTRRDEVLDSLSGLGAYFALPRKRWKQPLLVAAAGDVGEKLELANALDRHEGVGRDLVASVVDQIVCSGAEPALFMESLALARVEPERVEAIVRGIADACEEAGCALLGGTAEARPRVVAAGRYHLAGFGLGVVERDRALDTDRVEASDAVVAMASTGPHTHGYAVANRVVVEAGLDLADDHGLRLQTLGEALLRPARLYAPECLALARATEVHALSVVGEGGVAASLGRVLPEGLGAIVDADTFTVPGVFRVLQAHGALEEALMWRTFNMGAGMLAVVADGQRAVEVLRGLGVDAWVCGAVRAGAGVRLAGAG